MKKRIFIVHGWGYDSGSNWYLWLKNELEQKGYDVMVPNMPDTENPTIGNWVPYLTKLVGKVDEHTYFVGHSIGCQTILRYLEALSAGQKVGGCIFVAGWFYLNNLEEEGKPVAKPWLNTAIDFSKIKDICANFKVILSNNDPFNAVEENKNIFEEKLEASVEIEHNKGHFSGEDGITELPSALQAVISLSNS